MMALRRIQPALTGRGSVARPLIHGKCVNIRRAFYVLPLLLAAPLTHAAESAAPAPYPTEYWTSDKDGWSVKTGPCDSGLCAHLVKFKLRPNDPPGYQPVDENNPDKARRQDKMCGHLMMGGFHWSKSSGTTWDGGWIYDPDGGSTYDGTITIVDQNTVKLRGFIGISLLGKTLVLRRQAELPGQCTDQHVTK